MKRRARFTDCIGDKKLIDMGTADRLMAKELLALVIHKEGFWTEAGLANKYPTLYLEGHYEIIKELCTAILAIEGWKALNHECLFAYLRKKKNIDLDFEYLLELKDVRNDIDYRGIMVSNDIWKDNHVRIKLTINLLKEYLQNRISS